MEQLRNSLEQHLTRITWQLPLQTKGRVGAAAVALIRSNILSSGARTLCDFFFFFLPPSPTPLIRSDTLLSSICPQEAHVTRSYREVDFIKRPPFHFLFHLSKYEKKRKESVDLFPAGDDFFFLCNKLAFFSPFWV